MRIHNVFPAQFPEPWASDWGEDEYGIFMGFTYKGVRQDFRWIEPGTFLMGSPEDELGRNKDEIQHEVTLTKGFWLGDTTVTQDLWNTVMSDNLSSFKGANRPVDSVSWYDAQRFIANMNGIKPELQLCLPSEAQWEYACRSGTITAFHFGGKNDLSLKRVNYSGKWDALNFNGETTSIKNYFSNDWGLYEMHGNVWEWCQDWYSNYPVQSVVDPQEAVVGAGRVLRGGSWIYNGKNCRSAYRHSNNPGLHSDGVGFRLARQPQ